MRKAPRQPHDDEKHDRRADRHVPGDPAFIERLAADMRHDRADGILRGEKQKNGPVERLGDRIVGAAGESGRQLGHYFANAVAGCRKVLRQKQNRACIHLCILCLPKHQSKILRLQLMCNIRGSEIMRLPVWFANNKMGWDFEIQQNNRVHGRGADPVWCIFAGIGGHR